jgi:dephospho-CoA kinase
MFSGFSQFVESVDEKFALKAVYMAGGAGSGKSFVANQMFGGLGFRNLDIDVIFELLAKNQHLDLKSPTAKYSPDIVAAHHRSKEILNRQRSNFINENDPLLIDTTSRDYEKIVNQSNELRASGYDTYMVYVHTSKEVAWERNTKRSRTVPHDVFNQIYDSVQQNVSKFKQYFGTAFLVIDHDQEIDPRIGGSMLRAKALRLLSQSNSNSQRLNILNQKRAGLTHVQPRFAHA